MGRRELHFRLAGINNQNFLMRDEETGSWWQQVSGKAIFGELQGQALDPVLSDELSFALWKQEVPAGQVLAPVVADENQYDSNWEPATQKYPTPFSYPGSGLQPRDVVIGLELGSSSRAYPVERISEETPVQDRLSGTPILLAIGPDGKSIRVFISRLKGADLELFRKSDTAEWMLVDSSTNSEWNFQGCATAGPAQGHCLERLPAIKDYWFDWRNYHPQTSIYRH